LAICGITSSILRIIMTAGHRSDCPYGPELVNGFRPRAILADRAYDTNAMIAKAAELKAELVVPSKSNRKFPRCITKSVYKRRNIIERVIGRLKDYRRLSMRFEKTDSNFFSFIFIAAALYNLNPTVNTP
jgi:putative transposase